MLDFTTFTLQSVCAHSVGNNGNGEPLVLSKFPIELENDDLKNWLSRFFVNGFTSSEFYNFSFSNADFKLNPLFNFSKGIFNNPDELQHYSIDIAKHLYESTTHPQIKAGDLFIGYLQQIVYDNKTVDAIAIVKSENKQDFLRFTNALGSVDASCEQGIAPGKPDKACLILNMEEENGYKICAIDNTNKSNEAQFWKTSFLNVKPCNDSFHATRDVLNLCKNYVTQQMPNDFEISKTEQIDLLNRSIAYFKTQDEFDLNDFSQSVIQDPQVIESFNGYRKKVETEGDFELEERFDISSEAVKKQNRIFKSVLKLDKNFHIYIHGKRELIEKGVDENGRKFYKIYFEEET